MRACPVRKDSLLSHREFRWLWLADTVSQFGTFGTHTVLPLLAATALAASPFEMGLLTAAEAPRSCCSACPREHGSTG